MSDELKRDAYDRGGTDGLRAYESREGRGDGGGGNSMFNNFFNRGQAAEERRAPDLEIPVRVTLTELLLGFLAQATICLYAGHDTIHVYVYAASRVCRVHCGCHPPRQDPAAPPSQPHHLGVS